MPIKNFDELIAKVKGGPKRPLRLFRQTMNTLCRLL